MTTFKKVLPLAFTSWDYLLSGFVPTFAQNVGFPPHALTTHRGTARGKTFLKVAEHTVSYYQLFLLLNLV